MTQSSIPAPTRGCFKDIPDDHFTPEPFDGHGFNIHRRSSVASSEVAIFIHGFRGEGYGTWGDPPNNFAQMLFDADQQAPVDVGVFRYNTGFIAAITRDVHLDRAAARLAQAIQELSSIYKSIYFICHSLGGLVAESAVKIFLDDCAHSKRNDTSIAAMFFFASPRAGTGLAARLLAPLIREFSWLSRFSTQTTTLDKFFTTNVESEPVANPGNRPYLIPRYACVGEADGVVSEFSVVFGVSKNRIKYLDINHKHLVKPLPNDRPQVDWVCGNLSAVRGLRRQWMRERAHEVVCGDDPLAPALLVTELWTGTTGTRWEELYGELRDNVSSEFVRVKDVTEVEDLGAPVDLLISVHDAERIFRAQLAERNIFITARKRHAVDEQLTVGVAAVGNHAVTAKEEMERWLLPDRPQKRFFIESARDDNRLEHIMRRWMNIAFRPGLKSQRRDSLPTFANRISKIGPSIDLDFGKGSQA